MREITGSQSLYLTFDDGPNPFSTPRVLNILDRLQVKATFFVVVEKAHRERALMQELLKQGHSIGNHSLDHGYRIFFRSDSALLRWVKESEDRLSQILGEPSVGFRPPAGVVTPPLRRVLRELNLPLVLWNQRFFDTVFTWTPEKARAAVPNTPQGSIVLLHDRQSCRTLPLFEKALEVYIEDAKRHFNSDRIFDRLTRELCSRTEGKIT